MDDQMWALYSHKLNQEKAGKLGKGRKADQAACLAVERLESIAQFNERFGQGQTSRHGIGWNHNKSVPSLENVKQATAWQANRNNQPTSRRQKDCVVNEVQHAKWISKLG